MGNHNLSTFGDHLKGHTQVWEYTKGSGQDATKLVITSDEAGKLWYHAYASALENNNEIEQLLGKSPHSAAMDAYEKRLTDHLGFSPEVRHEGAKGTTLTYKLPSDKAFLDKEVGYPRFSEETYNWLTKKRMISNHFPFEQLAMARKDVVRQLPSMPLEEMLEKSGVFFPSNAHHVRSEQKLLEHIRSDPSFFADLKAKLKKADINPVFKLSGTGANGVFLEAGDAGNQVVVAVRGDMFRNPYAADKTRKQVERRPIPQHLQPVAEYKSGNLDVEILPKLETDGIHYSAAEPLAKSIESTPHPDPEKKWYFSDAEGRNIGRSHAGTLYVLDGDAIAETQRGESLVHTNGAADWISEKGTWKQYEEFKPLHEKFNSPLHQRKGLMSSVASAVEESVQVTGQSSGKAKWVAGGIAAATVAIGAVVAYSKHKSHAARELERRQDSALNKNLLSHA